MLRHYQPPNLTIMDAIQRKELLHLRIEQANEEMQIVLSKMVEALFQTYQPEAIQEEKELTDAEFVAAYEADLKPMTVNELVARAKASEEDIAAGRDYTGEQVKAELQL